MKISRELVQLLDKLYGHKFGAELTPPPLKERINIYLAALKYVEKNIELFSYVLGHRRLVTVHECKKIDEILLEHMYTDPNIIPGDYMQRLPVKAKITQYAERLYMRDKIYAPQECELEYQLAAE